MSDMTMDEITRLEADVGRTVERYPHAASNAIHRLIDEVKRTREALRTWDLKSEAMSLGAVSRSLGDNLYDHRMVASRHFHVGCEPRREPKPSPENPKPVFDVEEDFYN